jgi:retron-type reverse transcriptase
MKGLERIKQIRKLNTKNPLWVNDDLYKIVCDVDVLAWAYECIKSKAGNMTKGVTGETLDGMSLDKLERISKALKEQTFQFSPARRKEIPKSNGKTRPLGIAPPTPDKIVQQAINAILTAIYEPTFSDLSHGFREHRGNHSALKEIFTKFKGTDWFVEGDIKSFFDEIDHHKLMGLLSKRVKDTRFLDLMWKGLRAGYIDEGGVFHKTTKGTPQGSVVSPTLANIYLDAFDKIVEEWISDFNQGEPNRGVNPEYKRLSGRLRKRRAMLDRWDEKERNGQLQNLHSLMYKSRDEIVEAIRQTRKEMLETPSKDSKVKRLKYVRYADDWLIGIMGSQEDASQIKSKASEFLSSELGLTLSEEKTKITEAKVTEAKFLGTRIGITSGRRATLEKEDGSTLKRRVGNGMVSLKMPTKDVVSKLQEGGYCDHKGSPILCPRLLHLDDWQIISYYNNILRGVSNYYSFAANRKEMWRIQYILQYSCAKTLAGKHKTKITRLVKKRGTSLKTPHPTSGKVYKLEIKTSWKSDIWNFMVNEEPPSPEEIHAKMVNRRSRSVLGLSCVICDSSDKVQSHHVRHVRKAGSKKAKGFLRILDSVNRKQIPVCQECHDKIHRGEYDGINLSEFANPDWYKGAQLAG